MDRIVVYSGTRNLYHDMVVSAKSLLFHHGADHVYFLIEDPDFPEPVPDAITAIDVSGQQWFPRDGPNYNKRWTYMILLRAMYTQIFPQYDVVLSLDSDSIVRKPIDSLWKTDLTGKYYAATQELNPGDRSPHYCFGTALLNLKMLRDGTDQKITHMLNTTDIKCPEQDAFSSVCAGKIATLPAEFCATWYNFLSVPKSHASIVNYTNEDYHGSLLYRQFDRIPWTTVTERMISWKKTDTEMTDTV